MGDTTTISAKIPREMRQKLEQFNVPISDIIREALEHEIRKREEEKVSDNLEHARTVLKTVPNEQIVDIIRADRDGR
nr:hypothetical protein [Candidatus Sigynarchaeota archaeon]